MEFAIWAALGAAIGYAASQRRGFSAVGGVVGGALLGPLFAWLMFLVSGVTRADQRKKCPHCAEWIQLAAVVCKHCQREIPAGAQAAPAPAVSPYEQQQTKRQERRRQSKLAVLSIAGTLAVLVILAMVSDPPASTPAATSASASSTANSGALTYANYQRLREGMSYRDVTQILGSNGKEISRSEIAGISTVMYMWEGRFGANMNAMFQNGELITKAQMGLR